MSGPTADQVMAFASAAAPFVEQLAQPAIDAIKNLIASAQGMTPQQRAEAQAKLTTELDKDKQLVDGLTANAKPD